MGGSQSRRDQSFKASEWEEVHDPDIGNEGDGQYNVVRNRVTGQLLDRYLLQFPNEQEYNKYMESVSYRRSEPNIVRIIHYEPKIVKQFCGSAYLQNVYLEHCRSRLSEYEDIPFPDYLYCAMATLDGYKKLYNKIGRFYVSEHQVMIDDQGEVRVWLNSDFSQNQAEDLRTTPNNFNGSNDQQFQMVDDIMKMIFDNSDQAQGPKLKLVDFYERQKNNYNNRVGFEEAKNIILDYSKLNNIQIPDIFRSVYEIYQGDEHRVPDTMAFKNQLLNNSMHSDNDHLHKVGAPVRNAYDTVKSVMQPNQSQFSANFSSATPGFVRDGSFNAIPNLASTMPVPGAMISTNRYPVASQQSFAPPTNNSFRSRQIPLHPNIITQSAPMPSFQRPILRQSPFIGTSPPHSQGFPITIRPNTNSNISMGRAPITIPPPPQSRPILNPPPLVQNFQQNSQQIPKQSFPAFSNAPIKAPSSSATQIQIPQTFVQQANSFENFQMKKKQSAKKTESLPEDLSNEIIGGVFVGRDKSKKGRGELGEQQLEIEKNIILKGNQSSSGEHQFINQANIIRDLSELHKIQQQQKSKRSAIQQQSSRNNSPNKVDLEEDDDKQYGYDQEYENQENSREILEAAGKSANMRNNQQYYEMDDVENLQREGSLEFQNDHKQQAYQPAPKQIRGYQSQPIYEQQFSFNNNQKGPRHVHQSPSMPQQGQNQYYGGFNPHMNSQGQRAQAPPALPQFNSMQFSQNTAMGQNQTNILNTNMGSIANTQFSSASENANKSANSYKKQFYYTLSNQIQLDPEIAADMALYAKS